MRWLKCILKLTGRGLCIALGIGILRLLFDVFWAVVFNFTGFAIGLAVFAVILGIMCGIAWIFENIGKFFVWAWTPPLLDEKEK